MAATTHHARPGLGVWRALGASLAGLSVAGAAAFAVIRPIRVLPRLGPAPAFRLIDERARPVTHESFLGRPALYSFFTTSSEDPTGRAMAEQVRRLAQRLRELPEGAGPLQLVTITLDPERDTPERLRTFAREVGADPQMWRFLTGPGLAVKLTAGTGFGVYYDSPPGVYDARYVLVDGRGEIRAVYVGPRLDPAAVVSDLELLRREEAARGAARAVYAAAHWFACYPVR